MCAANKYELFVDPRTVLSMLDPNAPNNLSSDLRPGSDLSVLIRDHIKPSARARSAQSPSREMTLAKHTRGKEANKKREKKILHLQMSRAAA